MFFYTETERNIPKTNKELYDKQVELLKGFLEHGAITQEQYNVSFKNLTEKMGMNKE